MGFNVGSVGEYSVIEKFGTALKISGVEVEMWAYPRGTPSMYSASKTLWEGTIFGTTYKKLKWEYLEMLLLKEFQSKGISLYRHGAEIAKFLSPMAAAIWCNELNKCPENLGLCLANTNTHVAIEVGGGDLGKRGYDFSLEGQDEYITLPGVEWDCGGWVYTFDEPRLIKACDL